MVIIYHLALTRYGAVIPCSLLSLSRHYCHKYRYWSGNLQIKAVWLPIEIGVIIQGEVADKPKPVFKIPQIFLDCDKQILKRSCTPMSKCCRSCSFCKRSKHHLCTVIKAIRSDVPRPFFQDSWRVKPVSMTILVSTSTAYSATTLIHLVFPPYFVAPPVINSLKNSSIRLFKKIMRSSLK